MNIDILKSAGIDYDSGSQRFNGEDAVYQKFLRMFPDDPSYYRTVKAINEGDLEDAFNNAHTLKGASGNLSLSTLYDTTSFLVEELRTQKTENLNDLLAKVTESYEKTVKAIREASVND